MRRIKYLIVFGVIAILCSSCQPKPYEKSELIVDDFVIKNPHDSLSPLTQFIEANTKIPVTWRCHVVGDYPIVRSNLTYSQDLKIEVLGLRPGTENQIFIQLESEDGRSYFDTLRILTDSMPAGFPDITFLKSNTELSENNFHLADFSMGVKGKFHTKPFVFDGNGDIRWYMDLSHFQRWGSPIRWMENDRFLVGTNYKLFEYDIFGQQHEVNELWPYNPHHEIKLMPNGNVLIAVDKHDQKIFNGEKFVESKEDFLIEYDLAQNEIVNEWDLRPLLDVDRPFLGGDISKGDWFHMNAISYSPNDDCIIASGRHQGVVKIDRTNNLEWIFAPHKDWGKSGIEGKGFETSEYLLKAVDEDGEAYSDSVQTGFKAADSGFDWPWTQHATLLKENGNLMLFDNGQFRFFNENPKYSRLVEYKIDSDSLDVEQIWEYGKERGIELYSPIISDIDLLKNGNILGTFGFLNQPDKHYARIIELSYPSNEVKLEVELQFKDLFGNGGMSWGQIDILYRAERINFNQNQ